MKKFIGKFHYLTQDLPNFSHLQQATMACNAGANWIQYRCFSKTDEQMLEELHQIAQVCDDWGTTLIITQHYHLIKKADIQGVHIEDMDADLTIIRNKIGDDKTLGASANTLQQIINHHKNTADYVGCGPFAHSNTKPNNETHWGIQGYTNAVAQLHQLNITVPLIAVGGINLNNVEILLQTGIYGVAVSEAVNKAINPQQTFKDIYQSIY
ncbi:MAG: thiamine phosphate synthase [Sphingobacteriales bacterium]|nr:MAG: thiamine phosphate synthase [Sphingobacteriales bacterium]